jgi:hypothetical protein
MKNSISQSSILGGSASPNRRAATIFLDCLVRAGLSILLACFCLSATAQNQWVWMGGSNQPGTYAIPGMTTDGNMPSSRAQASSWTDSSGYLWLFGGHGINDNGYEYVLNDVWKFNPATNQWALVSTPNQKAGIYGIQGTAASGNTPGGRWGASSWTDSSGNFWLFGGNGADISDFPGYLSDLWKFNPSTSLWAWMGGSSSDNPNLKVSYGTQGTFAPGIYPGGRYDAVSWTTTDSGGNSHLWLFGGQGFDNDVYAGWRSDLWEFNPKLGSYGEWAWMGGYTTIGNNGGHPGVYGTLRNPSATNIPGGRGDSVSWTDSTGHLWLFAGFGYDANGKEGFLNDLWKFDPTLGTYGEWTWMGGSSTLGSDCSPSGLCGQRGMYGTLGTPAQACAPPTIINSPTNSCNSPGSREGAESWIDSGGILWLYGGHGLDVNGSQGWLNDLWKFDPSTNQWTWVSGSNTFNVPEVNAPPPGKLTAGNIPGNRGNASIWTNSNGNVWLFGGKNYNTTNTSSYLNDLWEYWSTTTPLPTTLPPAATPTFNPAAGIYGCTQTVRLSSTTPHANIYYTTSAYPPSPGTSYTFSYTSTGPFHVSGTEVVKAIAVATNYTNSPVASATYLLVGAPYVNTLPASSITTSTATLNARVIADGAAGQAWFAYGDSPTLGKTTNIITLTNTTGVQDVSATITGLTSGNTYYFRVVAQTCGQISRDELIVNFKAK